MPGNLSRGLQLGFRHSCGSGSAAWLCCGSGQCLLYLYLSRSKVHIISLNMCKVMHLWWGGGGRGYSLQWNVVPLSSALTLSLSNTVSGRGLSSVPPGPAHPQGWPECDLHVHVHVSTQQ